METGGGWKLRRGATIPKLSVALFEREVVFKRDHRGAVTRRLAPLLRDGPPPV